MDIHAVHHSTRRVNVVAAIFGLLAVSSWLGPLVAAESYSEDAVKAAYLYRFAGYVDWPKRGMVETTFTIDVIGAPAIARELRRLLPGHPINHQLAQVREIVSGRDLGDAQIVYIAAGQTELLRSVVPSPSGPSMLLVTDEEGGLSHGSVLNFLTIDRNVRFEVSLTAARRWGLRISSELLDVAIRVQGRESQPCGPADGPDDVLGPCDPRMVRRGMRKGLLTAVKQLGAP